MLYRKLGKTGVNVSILGFGCMRLPILDGKESKIDEGYAIRMIRYAVDNGVNYIDTAYPYHGGMSEVVVGKALKEGYRDKVHLADKLPSWLIKSRTDMDKYLNEQLKKLQTDHIDFYLLHTLDKKLWMNLKKHKVFEFVEAAKADGRIKYIGFSFHDELPLFKEIVDSYAWDFCQIQYNYMDGDYQAGEEGLKYAAGKEIPIIVMEPLRGGSLTGKIPADIQKIWDSAEIKRSPAEWALRFVWDYPEVSLVLSGMSEMNQVEENIAIANEAYPSSLTPKEKEIIRKVKNAYKAKIKVGCTGCEYCMPCPTGVNIPKIFSYMNDASTYDDLDTAKRRYSSLLKDREKASNCMKCGKCESRCPQHIKIRDMLDEAAKTFGK